MGRRFVLKKDRLAAREIAPMGSGEQFVAEISRQRSEQRRLSRDGAILVAENGGLPRWTNRAIIARIFAGRIRFDIGQGVMSRTALD